MASVLKDSLLHITLTFCFGIDDDDWTEQVEHENEQDEEEAIVAAQHKINTGAYSRRHDSF